MGSVKIYPLITKKICTPKYPNFETDVRESIITELNPGNLFRHFFVKKSFI
jgi:hypothetical protein